MEPEQSLEGFSAYLGIVLPTPNTLRSETLKKRFMFLIGQSISYTTHREWGNIPKMTTKPVFKVFLEPMLIHSTKAGEY